MKMPLIILATMLCSKVSFGACSSKFNGSTEMGTPVCEVLSSKQDSDHLLFDITFQRTPPIQSIYDSAHMAVLKSEVDSLFKKYDLRSPADTTKRLDPPSDSNLEYTYSWIWITKADAIQMVGESFVQQLYYRESLPTIGILNDSKKHTHNTITSEHQYFDVSGRAMSGKSSREGFKLP
jgi:hypothetical protein